MAANDSWNFSTLMSYGKSIIQNIFASTTQNLMGGAQDLVGGIKSGANLVRDLGAPSSLVDNALKYVTDIFKSFTSMASSAIGSVGSTLGITSPAANTAPIQAATPSVTSASALPSPGTTPSVPRTPAAASR